MRFGKQTEQYINDLDDLKDIFTEMTANVD